MIAVLFARQDSIYKSMLGCDVWDIDRDARRWLGGCPVVAHPPCRAWGRLRHMAKPRYDERELGLFAVAMIRRYGGVLEHPGNSMLWEVTRMPQPRDGMDICGGWTLPIDQFWWGHKARKRTWLYIVGCEPARVPNMPIRLGDAPMLCGTPGRRRDGSRLKPGDIGYKPEIPKADRERTPLALARWLVDLASRCRVNASNLRSEALKVEEMFR